MADVPDKAFDHDYDGIREYDNPLPRWWVLLFAGCVIWAFFYFPYVHFGPGELPREKYEASMEEYYKEHPPFELPPAEELEAMVGDQAKEAKGKEIFTTYCASCHGPDGGGIVGPNLTDDYTLHGWGMQPIVKTVYYGVPEKGMLAWGPTLAVEDIYAVSTYVHSLRGTTPATPKDPQGEKIAE